MPENPTDQTWDVYLSYAENDRNWVESTLLPWLESASIGYTHRPDFTPGKPIVIETEQRMQASRFTLVILSPAYLQQNWQGFENILISSADVERGQYRLIPLILHETTLPPRLQSLEKIDLRQNAPQEWERLRQVLHGSQVQPPRRTIDLRWWVIGFALILGLLSLVWAWQTQTAAQRAATGTPMPTLATATQTQTAIPSATTIPASPTATPPFVGCPQPGEAVRFTLQRLLAAEAHAIKTRDSASLAALFAPQAYVWDAANQVVWLDANQYYTQLFSETLAVRVERSTITVQAAQAQQVWLTSGNTTIITTTQATQTYTNLPGSDHWVFEQNENGCWQIAALTFNAKHLSFPCYCEQALLKDTLECLINAESQAAMHKNLPLIGLIFAPNAEIWQAERLVSKAPPQYYAENRFALFTFYEARHTDLSALHTSPEGALYTSASNGMYGAAGATPQTYKNPPNSERWWFERNPLGCWVITRMQFNAAHLPTPAP